MKDVTIRSLYAPLGRPNEVDGSLVAIHALSVLFAAVTLVCVGYALGTGRELASACLMAIAGPGVAFFMTWALHSRAVGMVEKPVRGGVDDSEAQFRDLLKRG
jgi:Na+-driven multidrug efflux pump